MNSIFSIHTVQFMLLALTQVLIFNHINFLGYINPYPYILFIAFYPTKNSQMGLIFLSFLLGLVIDFFQDTGGVHAASSVLLAYARPVIMKTSFGTIYEHQIIRFNNIDFGTKLSYFTLLTVLHHFILFSLEIFNISNILLILNKTLFSSIFTILLTLLITIIFSRKNK